jgi:hypothetical protein
MNRLQKLQVATNANTPVNVLDQLATDGDCSICYGTTRNPNTPIHILERLATDDHYWVRYGAATHSSATEIVKRLYLMTENKTNK